jgi:UPF0755 protein
MSPLGRLIKIAKTASIVLIVILLFLTGWFVFEFNTAPPGEQESLRFEVQPGQSVTRIAASLVENGILIRSWPFLWGYRLFYRKENLKAGEYLIQTPLSPKQALHILMEGRVLLHPVTIPEGLTRREIAHELQAQGAVDAGAFMAASADPGLVREWDAEAADLEGYLFPETYHFPVDTTAEVVVEAMVAQFESTFSEDWIRRATDLDLSIRDTVILASLIEKETSLPEERSLVSAVFHNRLRIGMKLDCDPTIIYALKRTDSYTGRLRTRDLRLDSPYNTYLYPGLPPGPIANPGRGSLEAALYPADVDYLYFVSRNDGSHKFSRTFREHQEAVNRYQRRAGR